MVHGIQGFGSMGFRVYGIQGLLQAGKGSEASGSMGFRVVRVLE